MSSSLGAAVASVNVGAGVRGRADATGCEVDAGRMVGVAVFGRGVMVGVAVHSGGSVKPGRAVSGGGALSVVRATRPTREQPSITKTAARFKREECVIWRGSSMGWDESGGAALGGA